MKIIVGLGNPGEEYANTYHNVGMLAVNELAGKTIEKEEKLFTYAKSGDVVFIRPRTYMNESGKAVRAAIKKFSPSSLKPHGSFPFLVVFHDDSDIAVGDFKISFARNSAGH